MDLRRIDLNLLVAFDALMIERSVTRAALRLSIGQSAMSSTLARLRKELDDPILIRDGRGLVASPFAEVLAPRISHVLSEISEVLSLRESFEPHTAERTFTITANDYVTMTFLQPLIARLASDAPGVRLKIYPSGDDPTGPLRRNQVDLLLIPLEILQDESGDFHTAVLFHDRYLVAVDQDHPELGDSITLEQFSTLPYLATSSGNVRSLAEMQLDIFGIPRNVEITAGFGLAPFLLKGTRLITLIFETLARRIAEPAGIRLLESPVQQLLPITQIMAWTKRTDQDAGNRWLRSCLIDLSAAPLSSLQDDRVEGDESPGVGPERVDLDLGHVGVRQEQVPELGQDLGDRPLIDDR